jgi:hypothetical protein
LTRRLLLANITLAGRTGTEIVTRDLACGLAARGHDVTVYAPALGPIADELTQRGVRVTPDLGSLKSTPEIIHGHHFVETLEALDRFPATPAIFVCHDRRSAHSTPPIADRIRQYVAVDLNCLERLVGDWSIPESRTRVILNAVDTNRFRPRASLPASPARALIFSNYASPATHTEIVREACRQTGMTVDVVGRDSGSEIAEPETILGRYDIVFAKARCAMEAMASGAAVVLCDAAGSGPMVTAAEFELLRQWNFGARMLRTPLDPEALARQIRRYDPADASAVTTAIRAESSLELALSAYEALYEDVLRDVGSDLAETSAFREAAGAVIARMSGLELDLAGYRESERMPALSEDAISLIRIALDDVPSSMRVGASAFARVRLHNGLRDQALGSWPPYPLQWAYRWRPIDAGEFLAGEHPRTPIRCAVAPDTDERYVVTIVAPREPGRYVLRLTLVQERLQWLDAAAAPVYRDVEVIVTE